jgi:hypothetical protein
MDSPKYMRDEDLIEVSSQKDVAIDISPLLGTWVNTNDSTRGIVKVVIGSAGADLTVHVFAACSPEPCDWGLVKADTVYARDVRSVEAFAFSAMYDFGFMETYLQANLSLGLLVVAGFNTFKDDSLRSNYFSREFFYCS